MEEMRFGRTAAAVEELPRPEHLRRGDCRRRPQPPSSGGRRGQQHHRRRHGPGVFRLHRQPRDQPRRDRPAEGIAVAGGQEQVHGSQRQGQRRHVEHEVEAGQQGRPQYGHRRQRQFHAGREAAQQTVQRPNQQQAPRKQLQFPQPRPFAEQDASGGPVVRKHRRPEDLVARLRVVVPEHLEAVGIERMIVVLQRVVGQRGVVDVQRLEGVQAGPDGGEQDEK